MSRYPAAASMRRLIACVVCCSLAPLVAVACKGDPSSPNESTPSATTGIPSAWLEPAPPAPKPPSSAVRAVEQELQASRLRPPLRRKHLPRIAFASGVVARLVASGLEVWSDREPRLITQIPLEEPRALLVLADGALLAIGRAGLVRWEPGHKTPLRPRPSLLPGSEVFADSQQPNQFWVADTDRARPKLSRYRIDAEPSVGILLPEQTIELEAEPGGTLGVTREGVFVYVTPAGASRLAPSGAKLAPLVTGGAAPPSWLLASRRVDQSLWLHDSGQLERTLVSPTFKVLGRAAVVGKPHAVAVGDEGRLLAVVSVTGAGPRFELELFDAELRPRARALLPAELPDGQADWAERVTRNQEVVADPRQPRVAVGGPERLVLLDERANVVLSIPSM
jgi:hypothetical protein